MPWASWGRVKVWNALDHKKVVQFNLGHSISKRVCAIDISPHECIATGSTKTVFVWALETGERLLGRLHSNTTTLTSSPLSLAIKLVLARRVASLPQPHGNVTHLCSPIHDSDDGSLLSDLPIPVASSFNQSLAWSTDSRNLFALSSNGNSFTAWMPPRGLHFLSGPFNAGTTSPSGSAWRAAESLPQQPLISPSRSGTPRPISKLAPP
jgi:hypothetical protein